MVNPAPLRLELKGVTVLQQIRHRQCERQWFLFRLAGGWLSRLVGCLLMFIDVYWCWLMLIDVDWCWLMLIDVDWCWLMLIDVDWCWLMLIDVDWCWLMLIDVDWCWLMLIDVDWCWLMLIDVIDVDWCWLMLIDVDCWMLALAVKVAPNRGDPLHLIASHCAHSVTAVRRIEKSKARGAVPTNGVWRRITYRIQNCIRPWSHGWWLIWLLVAICLPLFAQCLMACIIWNTLAEMCVCVCSAKSCCISGGRTSPPKPGSRGVYHGISSCDAEDLRPSCLRDARQIPVAPQANLQILLSLISRS